VAQKLRRGETPATEGARRNDYREAVSGGTHLLAALLSVVVLVTLVVQGAQRARAWHVVSFAIFGASLILLYTASTLYHLLPLRDVHREVLRRLDHIMIYVLIAGTYTPVCLVALRGPWGWGLFGAVWAIAVVGIALKFGWIHDIEVKEHIRIPFYRSRWLSTGLYVLMGWLGVIAFVPFQKAVGWAGLGWLAAGGIAYTLGALAYAVQKPTLSARWFGFHELFHVLVMAGSFAHYWVMQEYVLPLP
jgi:hemolysin III